MPGLLESVLLKPWQATVHTRLQQTLLNTHWPLSWPHCSLILGPSAHKVVSVPSKRLFPLSCGSSVTKPTGLQNQIRWEFSVPLLGPQGGESVLGPRNFITVRGLLWDNCSLVYWLSVSKTFRNQERIAKREVDSNTSLPQQTRETLNRQPNSTPKAAGETIFKNPNS